MRRDGLRNVLNALRKHKGRSFTVAVMGVSPGVGVTHSVLGLANYLRRCRLKVAVVELSSNHHFKEIEGAYEGMGFDPSVTDSFKIKGVTYYKSMTREEMLTLYQQSYDVIVLDMGSQIDRLIDDFQLADLPLVVARMNDWKRQEINAFVSRYGHVLPKRSQWLLVHGSAQDRKDFSRDYDYKCHSMICMTDPFTKDKEADKGFKALFE